MSNIKPYVYRCEHKITKQFYIGYRYANEYPSFEDLGVHYFTSSVIVSTDFSNYNYEILSEYDTPGWAYEVEQRLIYENRSDPLLINRNFKKTNLITLDPKPVSDRSKEKYKGIHKCGTARPALINKPKAIRKMSEKSLIAKDKERIKHRQMGYYKSLSLIDLTTLRDEINEKARRCSNCDEQRRLLSTLRQIVNQIQRSKGVR